MCDNRVKGPEDAEDLYNCEVFSRALHGSDGGARFVEDCEIGLLAETRYRAKERDQKLQGIALTSCIILHLKQDGEPENWKKLHVGGLNGISCQHLQVLATHLLQKHWECQKDRTQDLGLCYDSTRKNARRH